MPKEQRLKNSHGGYGGRTLIQRIESQMDKRRKVMEDIMVKHGRTEHVHNIAWIANQGRYEGLAAALAILRSSSVAYEIERSNGRLGIE